MERVFKDDDVSRSSLSSGQLDGQAVGLAARVDHHHLQGEVWFGGWMDGYGRKVMIWEISKVPLRVTGGEGDGTSRETPT